MDRSDLLLFLAALVAGVVFFTQVPSLWPLVDADLVADREQIEENALAALTERGFDVGDWELATSLVVDRRTLDYVQGELGQERAQQLVRDGYTTSRYQVLLKKRGETTEYTVELHPDGQLLRFWRTVDDAAPGPQLPEAEAQALAFEGLRGLGLDPSEWSARGINAVERENRRDYGFTFERSVIPELQVKERATVRVAGDVVDRARRLLVLPSAAKRAAKVASAPGKALENVGFLFGAACALAAFWVFLAKLGEGRVRLRRSFGLSIAIFVGLLCFALLDSTRLFRGWEPLFARGVSLLDFLVARITSDLWMTIVLLGVIGAADALDRDRPEQDQRGRALWRFLSGHLADPEVSIASARGFAIGLLCGGTLAVAVGVLSLTVGTEVLLQPRAIFLDVLNSSAPPLSALLLFLNAALIEEIGYRWFGSTWLEGLTGKRWVALLAPALVFGLTHTNMGFLPPSEPFWGRAVVMTCVGLVWGWALFRYDALTVVLSHWVADLVVFNTPRLFSGEPRIVAVTVLTILVPLIPALLGAGLWVARRGSRPSPQP